MDGKNGMVRECMPHWNNGRPVPFFHKTGRVQQERERRPLLASHKLDTAAFQTKCPGSRGFVDISRTLPAFLGAQRDDSEATSMSAQQRRRSPSATPNDGKSA